MRKTCVHCGHAYGLRLVSEEAIRYPVGELAPPYTGNKKVVRFESWQTTDTEMVIVRTLWDGETYHFHRSAPFCTLRCALAYARAAYNHQ